MRARLECAGGSARSDASTVGRLRRKLRALEVPEQIETARAVGYVLR